jgi:uncharacterized membrane protein YbhN (UPF0104 family)
MVLVLIAAVWLLDKTSTIVDPLIAGFVLGAVSGVIVDRLEHLGWPRAAGAGLVTVALFVLAVLVIGLVLGGITSQASHIDASLSQALDKVQKWAQDLGISSAPDAAKEIAKAVPEAGRTLLNGVASGISGLTSLLVFLGFTIFAAFFLLIAGALLALIPVTPGGLGFVEAGLTGMLTAAGVGAQQALVSTLAYRVASFWLPLPVGAVAYVLFRRRYGSESDGSSTSTTVP